MNFLDLAWDDLNDWAGARVVARGKSYKGHVEDLRMTSEGALLARVEGGSLYSTLVRRDADGQLDSTCTCPYGTACKHAVAVILVFLDAARNNQAIPAADLNDERLSELDGPQTDDEDNETVTDTSARGVRDDERVRGYLKGLSKSELVEMLLAGRNVVPELRRQLADKADLKDGNIPKLIASARREIDEVSSEPAWTNHWKGESHIPDYSRVKQRLETLLSAGQADAVVELGAYLMERGVQQVNNSHDEGETGMEIADCMGVVFKAVSKSSLTPAQRLLWEIDVQLNDEYGILSDLKGPAESARRGGRAVWSEVADVLSARLAGMPTQPPGTKIDFSSRYKREQMMHTLLRALEQAGRLDEMIPILEQETSQTLCYVELVKRLAEHERMDEARMWAKRGFVETLKEAPGIAWQLEKQLRELAAGEKNTPLEAAYCALEFFEKPGVESFSRLKEAANRAGVWEPIHSMILTYLETGCRLDRASAEPESRKGKSRRKGSVEVSAVSVWPLPALELSLNERDTRGHRFPDTSTLVDIAIQESRHDDALRWYRVGRRPDGFGHDYTGSKVAEAIQSSHPDDALLIWKELVAQELKQAHPSAYQAAGATLKKIKALFARTNRSDEWLVYLHGVREQNSRRPRMLEVLDSLEGRRRTIM